MNTSKKQLKNRKWKFLVAWYFRWNLKFVSNILSRIAVISDKHLPLEKLFIDNSNVNLHSSQEHTLLLLLKNRLGIHSCQGLIKRVIRSCMYCRRRTFLPNPQTTRNQLETCHQLWSRLFGTVPRKNIGQSNGRLSYPQTS